MNRINKLPPVRDFQEEYRRAEFLTDLLENQFKIGGVSFGLDPILGLVPGIGDLIALILSLYIFSIGIRMELPQKDLYRMFLNIIFDFAIGSVPVLGDIGDIFFRSNTKNLKILRKYFKKESA